MDSQDIEALRAELDAMRFDIEFKNGYTNKNPTAEDSEELENEILFGGPNQVDGLIDTDIDESVVI